MIRVVGLLVLLTACGRYRFDQNAGDDAALADSDVLPTHDEDGDGLPDVVDPCPQIAGDNADIDGDGVGDACDPNPSLPTERFMRFATMQPGDVPFDDTTGWVQNADSLFGHVYVGGPAPNQLFITRPITRTIRADFRFNILAINGSATDQHQVATSVESAQPVYFAELNDNSGSPDVGIFSFDMVNGYVNRASTTSVLLHVGRGSIRIDANVTTATWAVQAGWTGQYFMTNGATPGYAGGNSVRLVANNLDIEIESITLVETQ